MEIKIESKHLQDVVVLVPDIFHFRIVADFSWRRFAKISSRRTAFRIILCKTTTRARQKAWFAVYTSSGNRPWAS